MKWSRMSVRERWSTLRLPEPLVITTKPYFFTGSKNMALRNP